MRFLLTILVFLITLNSCDYLGIQEKEESTAEIVAIVNTEKLFREDIRKILPQEINKEDSIILVRSFINDWAIKQLFLKNAETNNSIEELSNINKLVKDYRESLLINNYKEQLIKQRLDTIINQEEIDTFYFENKDNFKLNEDLIKIKYLHFDDNVINKKELIKLFKSDNIEDTELLIKQQLSFKSFQFNDSTWLKLDNIMLKLPFSKENFVKKTKFSQKQDSLGLYLASVNDYLPRNNIAPLSYVNSTIKQMILHKRKIQLIRDIEKILIEDATKNNNFKVY